MFALVPWTVCALPASLKRFAPDWKSHWPPNWYLPVHLGGLGVDKRYAPSTWVVTREQRLLAAHFVANPTLALYRILATDEDGKVVKPNLPKLRILLQSQKWKMHSARDEYYECHPWEQEGVESQLALRVSLMSRAATGTNRESVSDDAIFRRFRIFQDFYKLKPMTDEGLEKWWDVFFTGRKTPDPPPLQPLPLHQLEAEFHWLRSEEGFPPPTVQVFRTPVLRDEIPPQHCWWED